MLFVINCIDKPDALELRNNTRNAHIEYLRSSGAMVKLAGPFVTPDGQRMVGTMVVIDALNAERAKAWTDNEPYAKAGLFESVDIRPWMWLVNNPAQRRRAAQAAANKGAGGGAGAGGQRRMPNKAS